MYSIPRTSHLPIPSPPSCRVISPDNPHLLPLIRRTERITPLLSHPLHLPDLPNRLLKLLHTRSIVLDVILLNFLDMVVRLREVHALCVLPSEVAEEAGHGEEDELDVEDGRGEEDGDDAEVFGAEANFGGDGCVDGDEGEPDDHRSRDGEDGVFGPYVGDEGGFAEYGGQHGGVKRSAPYPVACRFAVALWQVVVEDAFADEIGEERVVEAVANPGPEGVHFEEDAFLAELIKLRVSVEETSGDELVEDAHGEGGEDGEEDVIEGEGPGFVDDLTAEGVLECILKIAELAFSPHE